MATTKDSSVKPVEKTDLDKFMDRLEGLLEKLTGHSILSSFLGFGILLIIAEAILPESTAAVIQSLLNLSRVIIERTAQEITDIRGHVSGLLISLRNYVNRRRPMVITGVAIYAFIMIISLLFGYGFEINWLFGLGTLLVIAPIIIIGYVQKKIGNLFKNPFNSWTKAGGQKISVSVLIALFALEFMLLHTILFLIGTALFMSVAFIGAGVLKRSLEPLESLKKLTYLYVGITFAFIFMALLAKYNSTADSVIKYISSYNDLKVVERNDQTEINNAIAKETEYTPWRLTLIDTEMRYGAYDDIDVKEKYKIREIIPANQPVKVIKDYEFVDVYKNAWIHVDYKGVDGWVQKTYLIENISHEDALKILSNK